MHCAQDCAHTCFAAEENRSEHSGRVTEEMDTWSNKKLLRVWVDGSWEALRSLNGELS